MGTSALRLRGAARALAMGFCDRRERERWGSIENTDLMSEIHIPEAGRGEWMETVKEASGEEGLSRKASHSDETPGLVDFLSR